jgi:hypothetical protein
LTPSPTLGVVFLVGLSKLFQTPINHAIINANQSSCGAIDGEKTVMASPSTPKPEEKTISETGVTDESVQVSPAHPMPEHFPEVHLDEDTGAVTIAAPAASAEKAEKADAIKEPPKDTNATIAAAPIVTSATVAAPVAPTNPAAPVPYAPADREAIQPNYTGYQAERQVCVRCGSTNLSRGYVVDFSDKFQHLHFAPRRMSTRRLNWALRPFRSLTQLNAVACRDCGAVLLVADPHELRKAERRRSED